MTLAEQQEKERSEALGLASTAQTTGTPDAYAIAFDALTSYLLDYCPDTALWEDFDPDVDGARQVIHEGMI